MKSDPRPAYPLATSGWRPGNGYQTAGMGGEFHAELKDGDATAWLGSTKSAVRWPADFSVRFDPVELIGPDGEVFAREGDLLVAGGGGRGDVFYIGPLEHASESDRRLLGRSPKGRRAGPP